MPKTSAIAVVPNTQIKPFHKNIIARLLPPEEVSEGGIVVPATMAKVGPAYADVLAVGPKVETIKVGTRIAILPGRWNILDENGLVSFHEDFERIIIGQV
jgi:co-chaperonin GroES (HSP10)